MGGTVIGVDVVLLGAGVCWSVVCGRGRVVQVSPSSVDGQCGKVVGPGGDVAGVEGYHAIGGAEAVDGGVVVGPQVLLVGPLANDGGWRAVTVCKAFVGWEALSVCRPW